MDYICNCLSYTPFFFLQQLESRQNYFGWEQTTRTLSIDEEWDDDDLPEVAEATWTLLHMLSSSSTYCRERENPSFGVQQWTWVNSLVLALPLNPLSERNFTSIAYSTFNVFVLCIFVLKTLGRKSIYIRLRKQAPPSRIETFLFVFSIFSRSKKVYR